MRPRRGYAAFPTNNGLTMLAAWPHGELQKAKRDIEGNYLQAVRSVFGDCLDAARREERVVGDAGYLKDPVTAQGITDAFHDAELCAAALDRAFTGAVAFDEVMADYQRRGDARVLPIYEFTAQLGRLEPPPPELQRLLGAIVGNPAAMDEFASVFAGTVSPPEFFDPDHIRQLVGSPA